MPVSIFSIPDELMPDVKKLERMTDDLSATMSREMSGAVNLMVHPLAGTAAVSALGLGIASHAFGMWMGAISGAAEATQRLFSPIYDEFAGGTDSFASQPKSPAARARSTARTLIDDARSAARNIADVAEKNGAEQAPEFAAASLLTEMAVELMPEDFRQPKAIARPAAPDDLKTISGIGPKLEQVLNGLGVWTFAQIAGWTREEIAWVDDYLGFKGRIGRDDWIGQATKFARAWNKH